MATVTPNFNWPVPTSTDLVKDGATAIEALGDSIDASLVDLKGGTTGQVLSKTSGTDMDFTWVTSDDANAIQNAIVDAKGDLIAASAADTPARLAVGNNGETLVADSSTSTGLRYQTGYNGNCVINGAFDIWQRGTSFVPASYNYGADRFSMFRAVTGSTISRQASGLTGFNYAARVQRDSGNTSTSEIQIMTTLETADCLRFAGQTITVSFYARAGANFSASSSNLAVRLMTGTGTDQPLQSFTGFALAINSTATLTTSWTRYSYTVTLASTVTEFGFNTNFIPVGTAGAADYYDITGIQIELGSVATTFKRASGGTIQGELAAAMRYYEKLTYASGAMITTGQAQTTAAAYAPFSWKVTKRATPSITTTANTVAALIAAGTNAGGTIAYSEISVDAGRLDVTGATGLVAGNAVSFQAQSGTVTIAIASEL